VVTRDGHTVAPGAADGFGQLGGLVPSGRGLTVAVLAHDSQRRALQPWLQHYAKCRAVVLSEEEAPEWRLEEAGVEHRVIRHGLKGVFRGIQSMPTPDVIVSLLSSEHLPVGAEDQLSLFASIFPFIRKGGAYVVDRGAAGTSFDGFNAWLQLIAAAENRQETTEIKPPERELARAIGTVAASRDLLVVTKRVDHFVKLKEGNLTDLLPAREPDLDLRVLETRRGGELETRARVVPHETDAPHTSWPTAFEYPALALRQYDGRIALSGATLMYSGHTILPDSFRWHMTANPDNPHIRSTRAGFARIGSAYRPTRELSGAYYQLDSIHPNHFGHLMTEVVSRLWGWDAAKRENPKLKAVVLGNPQNRRPPTLAKTLFTAFGIDESDVVWVDQPVWVNSAVSATPMWHNAHPYFAHPDIEETWDRLSEGLDPPRERSPHERIFVSRGPGLGRRACRNAADVEAFFQSRGFHIMYPEKLPLAQQVALFRDARVIAGFGGSAMFNLMFAKAVETTIVLNHESYTARNEHLFAALKGGNLHYFWSRADVDPSARGRSKAAERSAWDFDFARNGEALTKLLAGL